MKTNKQEIGNFIKWIQYSPMPIDQQRYIGKDKDLMVEDWVTIEIAKIFYIGIDAYLNDPPPRRFKNNDNFEKEKFISISRKIFEVHENYNENHKILHIKSSGRGLDVLFSKMQKPWEKIFCYDTFPYENFLFKHSEVIFLDISNFNLENVKQENSYVIESVLF